MCRKGQRPAKDSIHICTKCTYIHYRGRSSVSIEKVKVEMAAREDLLKHVDMLGIS